MRKILVLGLTAAVAAGTAGAETIDRQAALDSMVAAEHAFAKAAAEKGTREAFIEFLADDAVLFRPDPVPGKEWTRSQPSLPGRLSWYPTFAEVSLAGDMGYTTGPFELRAKGPDDPEVAHGNFVTVWGKQPGGAWKALFDQGARNPPPSSRAAASINPARPSTVDPGALPKVDAEAERAALLAVDRAFGRAAEIGTTAAFQGVLAEPARLFRTGRSPSLDQEAIRATLAADPAVLAWEPAGGGIALSADLGYTYGIAKGRESDPQSAWLSSHNYLRIWKKQPDASWKLVLDVLNVRPRPVEKPVEQKPSEGV